jgi:hypothetical protein
MPSVEQNGRENDNHARKVVAIESLRKSLEQAVDPDFSGEVTISVISQRGWLKGVKAVVAQFVR